MKRDTVPVLFGGRSIAPARISGNPPFELATQTVDMSGFGTTIR